MTVALRVATIADLDFAHDLARASMERYFVKIGRTWDESIFRASWPETENFVLSNEGSDAGTLRLSQQGGALWIRDIQILERVRGKGHGALALRQVEQIAASRGLARVRLAVFAVNPAVRLYERCGYSQFDQNGALLYFEKRAVG